MYFEEFVLGQRYRLAPVEITADRIAVFAEEYDPLPLHTDEAYAKTTSFGGLIAPGIMSFMAVWSRFARINPYGEQLIAGKNASIEWLAPVYAGDTLTGEATITGLTRRNTKNGAVQITFDIVNQDGKPVIHAVNEAVVATRFTGKEEAPTVSIDDTHRERFQSAIARTMEREHAAKGIGTLREKTLHAALKRYMEPIEDNHETKIGPYVADIVGEDGIIEIQTRGFNTMRKKLDTFLEVAKVTVVYPIPHTRWLAWVNPETGELSQKRRSPKQGSFLHAFFELYKIRRQLPHPNLVIKLLLVDMEEYRQLDGWSSNKKRGSTRYERIPVALYDELEVGGPYGYGALIPAGLPEYFTSRDFQEASGLPLYDAQTALNVLHYVGAVERDGKRGRMHLYHRV